MPANAPVDADCAHTSNELTTTRQTQPGLDAHHTDLERVRVNDEPSTIRAVQSF